MRLRVAVFGAVGTAATLLAAAIVFTPVVESVQPLAGVADALAEVDERQLLLVASLLVSIFLAAIGWNVTQQTRREADVFDEATDGPPEAVTTARQRQTAADLDGTFDAAIAGDIDAVEAARDRLRETAASAYARSAECEMEAARRAVRQGTWTNDQTAAAALAADDGPTHSLGSRLRLWLDPESERERRFTSATQAITALAGGTR